MSKVKKEAHAEDKSEQVTEPVSLTNRDAAALAQSFSTIAEHVARIATVYHRLAGSAAHGELPAPISAAATSAAEALEIVEVALSSPKKRKRDRDPDAPKRPGSSFLMFAGDRRNQLKKIHPELTNTEVMRELGSQWRDAPASVREPYERKYEAEINTFKRKSEEYTAGKDASGSPPTKVPKTTKTAKKPAPLSPKAANKSRTPDSDGATKSPTASKTLRSKKTPKAPTKSTKSKDTKKASSTPAADKKAQSGRKTPGKNPDSAASGTSKSEKKVKKGKTGKA